MTRSTPIRVFLVDDQTLVRQGIRSLLALAEGIEVVAEASDGRQAVEQIPAVNPDVVLMDMRMPAMSGLEALQAMDAELPSLLGTNAAYVPNPDVPAYDNGVIDLRQLGGRTLVGYMAGGIEASQPNAGWMMQSSIASDRMLGVYVTPLPVQSAESAQPEGFRVEPAAPNPFRTHARLTVSMDAPGPLAVEVFDLVGRRVATLHDGPLAAGPHTFAVDGTDWASGVYVARVTGERGTTTQRLVRLR